MTARDAVELCGLVRPRTAIPIHYEGWKHFREGREAIEREFAAAPRGRPRAHPLAADRGGSRPRRREPAPIARRRIRCARGAPVRDGAGRLPRQRAGAPGPGGGMGRVGDRRLRRARRPRWHRGPRRGRRRAPRRRRPHGLSHGRRRASTSRARERSPPRRSPPARAWSTSPATSSFAGSATRALTEEDEPDPVTAYGESKLEAERLCPPDALLVRTSLIYGGPVPSSHERAALEVADGVRDMTFFTDERRCPIAVADLAAAVLELAALDVAGPLHVAGADALTRLEFARLICAHHGRDPDVAARRARRPGAPQADRPGLLAGARPAARAPARRARGAVAVRAIVVGAGVVGLTTAVCLREAGIAADVVAREEPQDTTSAVAAALWYPYRALPQERVTAWSAATYEQLARLAGRGGQRRADARGHRAAGAPTRPTRGGATRCPGCGARAEGLRFEAPVVDMSRPPAVAGRTAARPRRRDRAPPRRRARRARRRRRGQLRGPGRARAGRRRVADRGARADRARARRPACRSGCSTSPTPSSSSTSSRASATSCSAGPRRRAPRTARPTRRRRRPIRARCAALVPALRDAPVVGVAVGLRPARPTVRLEARGPRRALLRPRRRRRDPRVGLRRRGSRTSRRARRALRCSAVK